MGLRALVVEDIAIGGHAGTSSRIENYMGFPTGISGAALVWRGEIQAMKFGTRFAMPRRAVRLEILEDGSFYVPFDNRQRVRGDSLAASMSSYLSSRLEADPLESLTIRDRNSGATRAIQTRALFIMVGAAPNTEWLSGLVKLDSNGYVITGSGEGSVVLPKVWEFVNGKR